MVNNGLFGFGIISFDQKILSVLFSHLNHLMGLKTSKMQQKGFLSHLISMVVFILRPPLFLR